MHWETVWKERAVDLTEYLGGLKRRWRVIVAALVVAIAAGLLTGFVGPGSSDEQVYEARAAILSTEGQNTNMNNVSVVALYGEVPRRVAEAIDYEGDPRTLSKNITTEVSKGTGFMWIVARSKSPDRAALIANTYARELVRVMTQGRIEGSLTEAERLQRQMRRMGKRIAALDDKIATAGPTQAALLTAQRDSAIRQYGLLADRHQQATGISLEPAPIQVLQDAPRGEPAATLAGPLGRTSPASRLVLAAVLGLLGGVVLALVLERFDNRIRTKKSAETHFSLPVLAEIPITPRRMRGDRAVLAASKPRSPFADSFRLLATGLSGRISAAVGRDGAAAPEHVGPVRSPQTILVTSPRSGEGKTTVTANLAASFAEQGKRVLVLSCDFRSPNIHKMFDVPNDKGLAEALRSPHDDGFLVDGHVKKTSIREINVVPSSSGADNPGGLLSSDNMEDVLLEAREKADVVLLDTAPILTGAESAVLFPKVDAVLVVARVGTTTVELAERTSDLLARLGSPVVGVALNGSTDVGDSRRGYRDSSKPSEEKSRPSTRKERRKASKAGPSSKADTAAPKSSAGGDEKSTATVASGGASSKATGTAQSRDKGKGKQLVPSESRSPEGGPAPAEESRGMKEWEL
jgi:capsular exopolysaccharide synthesis family protein